MRAYATLSQIVRGQVGLVEVSKYMWIYKVYVMTARATKYATGGRIGGNVSNIFRFRNWTRRCSNPNTPFTNFITHSKEIFANTTTYTMMEPHWIKDMVALIKTKCQTHNWCSIDKYCLKGLIRVKSRISCLKSLTSMLLLIMSKATSHLIDIPNNWPIIVMKV